MHRLLHIKQLLILSLFSISTVSFAAIDFVGNMWPASGSSTEIALGDNFNIYIQAYKAGTTEPAGQGSGINCEIYYGEVLNFGGTWQNIFSQPMTYNVDIGNNDEYQGIISPSAGLYEFTCRCSDDGGSTWTWASNGSGNGQLTVTASLPIELTSFEGEAVSEAVQLSWTTASENDNSHFEIERSQDGKDWESIGQVEGAIISQVERNYIFRDLNPMEGEIYYRLKQVDLGGDYSFSEIILVKFEIHDLEINIFPNPVSEKLTIQNIDKKAKILELWDTNGRLVTSNIIDNQDQYILEMNAVGKGIYLLRITDRSGNPITSKRVLKK